MATNSVFFVGKVSDMVRSLLIGAGQKDEQGRALCHSLGIHLPGVLLDHLDKNPNDPCAWRWFLVAVASTCHGRWDYKSFPSNRGWVLARGGHLSVDLFEEKDNRDGKFRCMEFFVTGEDGAADTLVFAVIDLSRWEEGLAIKEMVANGWGRMDSLLEKEEVDHCLFDFRKKQKK